MPTTPISPDAAKARLDSGDGVIYLDVRTCEEFEHAHVPGAMNVPIALVSGPGGQMVLNDKFATVVSANLPKDQEIIVGCKAGPRGDAAVQMMTQLGYTNVVNMAGGLVGQKSFTGDVMVAGWLTRGYPLASEAEPGRSYDELATNAGP